MHFNYGSMVQDTHSDVPCRLGIRVSLRISKLPVKMATLKFLPTSIITVIIMR